MPLQSGSDAVLKAMRRSYRQERYLSIIDDVRARIPDAAITTDIIVGFPGETEADFAATLDVVRAARFAGAFTFQYSPRPGTPAAGMADQVPKAVVQERYERLVELQDAMAWAENRALVGRTVEVLVAAGRGPQGRGDRAAVRAGPRQPPRPLRPGRGPPRPPPRRPRRGRDHLRRPAPPGLRPPAAVACAAPAPATPGTPAPRPPTRAARARRPPRPPHRRSPRPCGATPALTPLTGAHMSHCTASGCAGLATHRRGPPIGAPGYGRAVPVLAAAFCPHPPLLVPELAGAAAPELDALRRAATRRWPRSRRTACRSWSSGVPPTVPSPDVRLRRRRHPGAVGCRGPAGGDGPAELPLSLTIGAWLLDRAAVPLESGLPRRLGPPGGPRRGARGRGRGHRPRPARHGRRARPPAPRRRPAGSTLRPRPSMRGSPAALGSRRAVGAGRRGEPTQPAVELAAAGAPAWAEAARRLGPRPADATHGCWPTRRRTASATWSPLDLGGMTSRTAVRPRKRGL